MPAKSWKVVPGIVCLSVFLSTAAFAASSYYPSGRAVPYAALEGAISRGHWILNDSKGVRYSLNASGLPGGASVGLGYGIGPAFWLAGEFSGNFTSNHTSIVYANTPLGGSDIKLRELYAYEFSLLPGIRLGNRFLVFARLGATKTRFKIWQALVAPSASSVNQPFIWGEIWGAGVQVMFWQNWSARAEYDRLVNTTFTSFNNRITAKNNQLRLGVVYTFI